MALSLGDQASFLSGDELAARTENSDFVIQIWDLFGRRIYYTPGLPLLNRAVLDYSDLTVQNERWRVYAYVNETSVIQVAQPWSVREKLARESALRVLLPLLLLMALMAVVAAWIVARAMRPLKSVTTQIEHRDIHSLAPLTATDLPTEVSPLVEELNRLLERLSAAFASQRAFVADAAHELRSPLTALSLQLQLLERARDEPDRALATTRLRAAVERATHLVSQLLTLARNEPEGLPPDAGTTALGVIVRNAAEDVQPLAQQRRIGIELDAPVEISVKADAEALRILVRNLIDNAVRYSPEGIDGSGTGIPQPSRTGRAGSGRPGARYRRPPTAPAPLRASTGPPGPPKAARLGPGHCESHCGAAWRGGGAGRVRAAGPAGPGELSRPLKVRLRRARACSWLISAAVARGEPHMNLKNPALIASVGAAVAFAAVAGLSAAGAAGDRPAAAGRHRRPSQGRPDSLHRRPELSRHRGRQSRRGGRHHHRVQGQRRGR